MLGVLAEEEDKEDNDKEEDRERVFGGREVEGEEIRVEREEEGETEGNVTVCRMGLRKDQE
jgi:hypothetical protein